MSCDSLRKKDYRIYDTRVIGLLFRKKAKLAPQLTPYNINYK